MGRGGAARRRSGPGGGVGRRRGAARRRPGRRGAGLARAGGRGLRRAAVAAVREAAAPGFRVLLHADPAAHRCGANAGTDPAGVFGYADGVVVPCGPDAAQRADALGPFAAAPDAAGATLAANFTVVSGMGGSPATLAADAAHAAALGAGELRLYHAGLASDRDLAAVGAALETLSAR